MFETAGEAAAAFATYSPAYARFVSWAWLGLRQQQRLPALSQTPRPVQSQPFPDGGKQPGSLLLTGPPGTGKTAVATALADGMGNVSVVSMTPSNTGDAADVLEHIATAQSAPTGSTGCMVVVDDAHVLFPHADDNPELDLLARTFASFIRGLQRDVQRKDGGAIIVLFITHSPSALHPVLKDAISATAMVATPTLEERVRILQSLLAVHADADKGAGAGAGAGACAGAVAAVVLDVSASIPDIAEEAQGLTGAELQYLCSAAATISHTRSRIGGRGAATSSSSSAAGSTCKTLDTSIVVRQGDIDTAFGMVRDISSVSSASPRGRGSGGARGVASVPTGAGAAAGERTGLVDPWSSICGYTALKARLATLVRCIRDPSLLQGTAPATTVATAAAGAAPPMVPPPSGVLLYGASGVGKSAIARAMAADAAGRVFAVGSTSLVRSEVGESERAIRELFAAAARAGRATIILDDIHVLFRSRQDCDGGVGRLVTTQLLLNLDQVPKGVVVIATTSRPEVVDAALLRRVASTTINHHPLAPAYQQRPLRR